jgi:hypothetical protein
MESPGLQAPATRDGCAFLSLGFEVRAITGCKFKFKSRLRLFFKRIWNIEYRIWD